MLLKVIGQVLLQGLGGFHVVQGFTPLMMGQCLLVLEEGMSDTLVLHLQETPGTWRYSFANSKKTWLKPSIATSLQ